jgi:outer membrane protein insertion porin family
MTWRRWLGLIVLLSSLLLLAWNAAAQIAPGAIVRDIEIRGNRLTQESTIRFYLETEAGKAYVPRILSEDIKRLYALETFDDIRVTAEAVENGLRLIITVTEKPTVRRVTYSGDRAIPEEEIDERIQLKERATFDRGLLNDTITGLQSHYRESGYYFAHVRPVITPMADNQVDIELTITEGRRIRIHRIQFTGNTYFTDNQLRKEVQLKEYSLPVVSGSGSLYRPEVLRVDLQLLEQLYQNNGFVNVQIGEPVVEINREAGAIVVTVPIAREGEQYKVGAVTLTGGEVLNAEELRGLVRVTSGEIYSRETMRRDILALTEAHADRGYAFVDIVPSVSLDQQTRLVNIGFTTHPGPKVYIGRIDIIGNERTQDRVIRRELRLNEGDLYSGSKLRRSRQRLNNLQYFEEVNINTSPRAEDDLLDLEIQLRERSTGQFSAGLGFSSVENVVFTASVVQNNLFGRGQSVSANAHVGGISQDYSLSFREPWLYGRPISLGASVFNRAEDFQTFDVNRSGASVSLGRAIGEFARISAAYRFEVLDITNLSPTAPERFQELQGESTTSSVTPSIVRDSRDNVFNPSEGSVNSFEIQLAGLGGDNRYYRAIGNSTWYFALPADMTGFVRGRFGFGDGYGGGDKDLPLSERFFLGGVTTIRGFEFRDIGPKDTETGDPLGGTSFVQFNIEIGRSLGSVLRVVAFVDVGNVYDSDNDFDIGSLRRSAGLGVRIVTPIGPIRLDYGFKLDKRPGESAGRLGFLLGTF